MAEIDGEFLLSLARDKSGKRRQLLAETISDLFTGKDRVLSERERSLMFDILHKMVHNAEMAIRRIIAEQLSNLPDAPRDLIKLLANDEVEVAYSLLRDSAVLENEDLIEVIQHRTREYHLAVSMRRTVPEDISDALVETGDESVITTLLKNSGAKISLATMEFRLGAILRRLLQQAQDQLLEVGWAVLAVPGRGHRGGVDVLRDHRGRVVAEEGWPAGHQLVQHCPQCVEV